VCELALAADLWVLHAGSAHTDLLAADPDLTGRLTAWLVQRLAGTAAQSATRALRPQRRPAFRICPLQLVHVLKCLAA
jgi:hypothetical protein